MPASYAQLIESALIEAASRGPKQFSLIWLRQRIRTEARRVKRQLGPRMSKVLLCTLENEAKEGRLQLQQGRHLMIYMSAGGCDAYLSPLIPVTINTEMTSVPRTRSRLIEENRKLKTNLLKIETRLARAKSVVDGEDGDARVVTGSPADITERIQRLVMLSKDRKHQIELMHEYEQERYNMAMANHHYEQGQDMEERELREAANSLIVSFKNEEPC